jgi:hypothetical protein
VVATNGGGDSDPEDSAPTATILGPVPVNQTPPDFAGYLVEGEVLSAIPGTWSNSPTSYAYQWYSCDPAGTSCPDIADATSSAYILGSTDVGRYVGVEVVASNAGGPSEPSASDAFGPIALAPPFNLDPPAVAGIFRVGETVTAQPGVWSGRPTRFDYQWYSCDAANAACNPIAGATATAYTIVAGDLGRRLGVGVVAANAGGASEEAGSLVSPVVAAAAAAPPPPPPAPPAPVALPARGSFTWAATRVRTDGRIALTVRVATPGAFTAAATTSTNAVYARGSAKARRAGTVTLVLKPTTTGNRTLRRKRTLRVRVKVTFRATSGGAAATKTRTVSVRARAVRRSQVRVARRPATALPRYAAPRG